MEATSPFLPYVWDEAVVREMEGIYRCRRPGYVFRRSWYAVQYSWAVAVLADRLGGGLAGARVADAGGGSSAVQHYLARRCREAVNVDLRPAAVPGAEPAATLVAADLEDTGLVPGSLDGIVSVSALEHNPWDKLLRVARHLAGLLRPGGVLVATVPAGPERRWVPAGGWGPTRRSWPQAYVFDAGALLELRDAVAAEASWEWPPGLDAGAYAGQWAAAVSGPGGEPGRSLFLPAGFVLRRRSGGDA